MPSIASIAAFAGWASLAIASPVEKLQKRAAHSIQMVQHGSTRKSGAIAYEKALKKFNRRVPTAVAAAAAAAQTGVVTATPEQYDAEYLAPVTIGNQTLMLDFDTGSADLWVFSTELPSSESSGHTLYTPSASKVKSGYTWSISYGDGSGANGNVYTDTVKIGGVTATSQAVEAAQSVSSEFVSDTQSDGLVGLAFSDINTVSPRTQTTFFDTVKASLSEALFAADLKKDAPGSYDFGYIDTSKYTGSLAYTNVDSSQGFWGFTASGYAVGSGSTKVSSISAIADTGTTLLLLPTSVVKAYYAKVPNSKVDNSQGGYVFPCSATLPSFSLVIGGATRTVPGTYLNYAPASGSNCFGGLQEISSGEPSIVGDVFLKSQYVVFDQTQGSSSPRLGFGQQAS